MADRAINHSQKLLDWDTFGHIFNNIGDSTAFDDDLPHIVTSKGKGAENLPPTPTASFKHATDHRHPSVQITPSQHRIPAHDQPAHAQPLWPIPLNVLQGKHPDAKHPLRIDSRLQAEELIETHHLHVEGPSVTQGTQHQQRVFTSLNQASLVQVSPSRKTLQTRSEQASLHQQARQENIVELSAAGAHAGIQEFKNQQTHPLQPAKSVAVTPQHQLTVSIKAADTMQQQQHQLELQRRHELLKAEHERAMDLVALEKAAAAAAAATAEEWGRRAEEEGKSLALKEAEIRRRLDLAEDALSQREYEVKKREQAMESAEKLAERYSLKEQALWAAEQGMKERESALHRGELAVVQVRKEADTLRSSAKEAARQVSEQRQVWEQDLGTEQAQAAELKQQSEERIAAMNAECQGTTTALAGREQRLQELEAQFHAERGMLQLQDQEASARTMQDLQHLDGCIFEANRRLQVAEQFAAGAEGEAQGAEGMLGRLRDQVEQSNSQLQLLSAAVARTHEEGQSTELTLHKMRTEAQQLRSEMSELVQQREEVLITMQREQEEWDRQQQMDMDSLQQQGLSGRAAAERMRADVETLVSMQEAKALDLEAKLDAEEERLGRGAARLDADEARLHTLSQDLSFREREIDTLATHMSKEAEDTRAAATAVASERALLGSDRIAVAVERVALERKEAELATREEETRVLRSSMKADADRQLQERDRALTEDQARVNKRSMELEAARGASELEMQRREMKAEMLERETLAASKALQLRLDAQAFTETKNTRDLFERDAALRILETTLRGQQGELQSRSREVADAKERVVAERQATSAERADLERSWADARRAQRESESSREAAAALTERAVGRERRAKESEERAAALERDAAGRVAEGTAAVVVARERETAAVERERVAARLSEASETWLSSKVAEESRLLHMREEATVQTTAAASALEEAGREQKVADGLRKVLASIEGGLELRESRLLEQWTALHTQAAAFRRGAAPRDTLLEDWKENLPHHAMTSAASRRPLPTTSLLTESSRGPEHAAVAVEKRRAALMERESELQQWSMSLQLGAAQLAVYEAGLRGMQEEVDRASNTLRCDADALEANRSDSQAVGISLREEREALLVLAGQLQDRSSSHDTRQAALDSSAFDLAGQKAQVSRQEADNIEQRRQIELRTKQSEEDATAMLKRAQAEAGALLHQAEEAAASKARRLEERLLQLETTALATAEAAALRLRQIEQSADASSRAAAAAALVITKSAEGDAAAVLAAAAAATKAAEEAGARAASDGAAAAAARADVDQRIVLVEEMEGRLRVLQQQLEARRGQVEAQERALQSLQSLLEEVHEERAALAINRGDLESQAADITDAKAALAVERLAFQAETAKLSAGFLDLSTGVSQLEGLLERQAELEAREAELNEEEAHLGEFHSQLQLDTHQLQEMRSQLAEDAAQLTEREAGLVAAQEDLEKFKHGRAALIEEIQGQQEGLVAQERSLVTRREAVHTSEASMAAEIEGVARRGAEVEALRARVLLEGQVAEGLRQRCTTQLAELDRRQVALDQGEDEARGLRIRSAASASEQTNALHQEQETMAVQRAELSQQRQQWTAQQADLATRQQQCSTQQAQLQQQQQLLAGAQQQLSAAQQRLGASQRQVEEQGSALSDAKTAAQAEGRTVEARMSACVRLEAAASAAHQRVLSQMMAWEGRATGLMDTRQAQVQSFFQQTTAGLDAKEVALRAMQGRASADLDRQVTALESAADNLRQQQQLSLELRTLTAAATTTAANHTHQQQQQDQATRAHLHTQQRCSQLQDRLQEQQRECLQLQAQLNTLQDSAVHHATEIARLTVQLRDAHAASVAAIQEGDRRVASAENARAQAIQNLSTLQTHQRSLIASSEASAAQLSSFQMERDAHHCTVEERVAAATQAATAALADKQTASSGLLQTQEDELRLLRSEITRLTSALLAKQQLADHHLTDTSVLQISTSNHQTALDEKNKILLDLTNQFRIQSESLSAAEASAAASLRQQHTHDQERQQWELHIAELETDRLELRRQVADIAIRGRGFVADESALAALHTKVARTAAELEAGGRDLAGRMAEAKVREGRLQRQQQELSDAQQALAYGQAALAVAEEELTVQKVSLVRMTEEKARSLEALAQHQSALDEQQRTLEAIRAEMGVKLSDGMAKMAQEQKELHTAQVALSTQRAELESRELSLPGVEAAAAEAGVHVQREAELLRKARAGLEEDRAVLQETDERQLVAQLDLQRGLAELERQQADLADRQQGMDHMEGEIQMKSALTRGAEARAASILADAHSAAERLTSKALAVMSQRQQQQPLQGQEQLRQSQQYPSSFKAPKQLREQGGVRNSINTASVGEGNFFGPRSSTAALRSITNQQLPYSFASDGVAARLSFSQATLDPNYLSNTASNTNNMRSSTVNNRPALSSLYEARDDPAGLRLPEPSSTPMIAASVGGVGARGLGRRAGDAGLTEPWLPPAEILETLSVSSGTTAAASDRPLIGSVLPEAQRREARRLSTALGVRAQPSQRFSELVPLRSPFFGELTSRQQPPSTEPRVSSAGGGDGEGGASSGGSSGDTMRQQRTLQVLLASLQHSCERGGERLQRLSRILDSLAGDAADPRMVARCFAALAELRRELAEMQRGGSVFSQRAAAAVDRTEQTSVRRALESQQRLLARWEEAVAGQMEIVTSLQEPAQRSSLINSLAASRDLSMSFNSRRG